MLLPNVLATLNDLNLKLSSRTNNAHSSFYQYILVIHHFEIDHLWTCPITLCLKLSNDTEVDNSRSSALDVHIWSQPPMVFQMNKIRSNVLTTMLQKIRLQILHHSETKTTGSGHWWFGKWLTHGKTYWESLSLQPLDIETLEWLPEKCIDWFIGQAVPSSGHRKCSECGL